MYEMTDEEFEQAVEDALASIPPRFLNALENVGVTVADAPSAAQLAALRSDAAPSDGTRLRGVLLGLYEGVPLTQRGWSYGNVTPDVVTIFRRAHEQLFSTREDVVEQIRKTVVHEIGHYFGLSDADLRRMGY